MKSYLNITRTIERYTNELMILCPALTEHKEGLFNVYQQEINIPENKQPTKKNIEKWKSEKIQKVTKKFCWQNKLKNWSN